MTHSPETVVFFGAGATAALGMPTTAVQAEFFSRLCCGAGGTSSGLDVAVAGAKQYIDKHLNTDDRLKRGWECLKQVAGFCPAVKKGAGFGLADLYNVLDYHLQIERGMRADASGHFSLHELEAARDCLKLLTQFLFACKYKELLAAPDRIRPYQVFFRNLATLMQQEGEKLDEARVPLASDLFFGFSYGWITTNWDPLLIRFQFMAHYEANRPGMMPCVGAPASPLKLFNSLGLFMATCPIGDKAEQEKVWYPYNETVAYRFNDPEHATGKRIRLGKLLHVHGCFAWRECPSCGKLTSRLGKEWDWHDQEVMPAIQNNTVVCLHCGAKTDLRDAPLLLQSNFKPARTPLLDPLWAEMRVMLEHAKHVVLLGYSLPSDDSLYKSMFAARLRLKDKGAGQVCVSVAGYSPKWSAGSGWLTGDELETFVREMPDEDLAKTVQQVASLNGHDYTRIRASGIGVPAVFGDTVEAAKELLYPPQWLSWERVVQARINDAKRPRAGCA